MNFKVFSTYFRAHFTCVHICAIMWLEIERKEWKNKYQFGISNFMCCKCCFVFWLDFSFVLRLVTSIQHPRLHTDFQLNKSVIKFFLRNEAISNLELFLHTCTYHDSEMAEKRKYSHNKTSLVAGGSFTEKKKRGKKKNKSCCAISIVNICAGWLYVICRLRLFYADLH